MNAQHQPLYDKTQRMFMDHVFSLAYVAAEEHQKRVVVVLFMHYIMRSSEILLHNHPLISYSNNQT
jgi:hypothetical protein